MVSKLDYQTYTSDFMSHWVPHQNKKLSKLLYTYKHILGTWCDVMVDKLD